jgi:hypothetical protein
MVKTGWLLFCLILLSQGSFAQDWKIINPDKQYYFAPYQAGNITSTIKVDVFVEDSTELIYELNRIVVQCDTCPDENISWSCNNCLWHKDQPQFLGKEIHIQDNVWTFIFDTTSFEIRPNAPEGQSWLFSEDQQILATVLSQGTQDLFGVEDSIKTIGLSNGGEIMLSRNHGLMKFEFDGNTSKYQIGQRDPVLGTVPPDFESTFDVPIRTVLECRYSHVSESNDSYDGQHGQVKLTVTSINIDDESVELTYDGVSQTYVVEVPWKPEEFEEYAVFTQSVQIDKDQIQIDQYYPLLPVHIFSDSEVMPYFNQSFEAEGAIGLGVTENGRQFWYSGDAEFLNESVEGIYFHGPDEIGIIPDWAFEFYEVGGTWWEYYDIQTDLFGGQISEAFALLDGVGIAYLKQSSSFYAKTNWSSGSTTWKLTGYVLDGDTVGTITADSLLTAVKNIQNTNSVDVYPNPASRTVMIESQLPIENCILYSIDGAIVKAINLDQPSQRKMIHLDGIKPGMYLLNIQYPGSGEETKRIIIY